MTTRTLPTTQRELDDEIARSLTGRTIETAEIVTTHGNTNLTLRFAGGGAFTAWLNPAPLAVAS